MALVLGGKYSRKYRPPLCAVVLRSVEKQILIQKYKYVKKYHLQNIDPIFEKKSASLDNCTRGYYSQYSLHHSDIAENTSSLCWKVMWKHCRF
jgi:hypothetical protein